MFFISQTTKLCIASLIIIAATAAAPMRAAAKDPAEKTAAKKAWALICAKDKTNCRLYAQIKTDQNIVASSVSLVKMKVKGIKEAQTVAFIMLPLGLHIPSGVTVQVDKKITIKANLIECKAAGCRAIFNVSKNVLNHMLDGKKVNVVIVDSKSRKQLRLGYSLAGFDQTYKAFAAIK